MFKKNFTGNNSGNNSSVNQNLDQAKQDATLSEATNVSKQAAYEIILSEFMNVINDAYNGDDISQYIYGKFCKYEYERTGHKPFLVLGLFWLRKSMRQGNKDAQILLSALYKASE